MERSEEFKALLEAVRVDEGQGEKVSVEVKKDMGIERWKKVVWNAAWFVSSPVPHLNRPFQWVEILTGEKKNQLILDAPVLDELFF